MPACCLVFALFFIGVKVEKPQGDNPPYDHGGAKNHFRKASGMDGDEETTNQVDSCGLPPHERL